jgi:hypothetical protein
LFKKRTDGNNILCFFDQPGPPLFEINWQYIKWHKYFL